MENAERKARRLLEYIMSSAMTGCETAQTVFDLLAILDPADFVVCGYSAELEACLEKYADHMDDAMQKAIMQALKIIQ